MYKWYQQSGFCYVYLSDVDMPELRITELSSWVGYRAIFGSRWWSRGWTLQELLAPEYLGIFDLGWKFLGTKAKLASEIACKTRIDKDVLAKKCGLNSVTTAQKMAWASSRETTREEDMAHCLLGLFGVNMPLLYGEGVNAFQRLQEAILAVTDDESILTWADTYCDPALFGPLAPHPRAFRSSQDILRYFDDPNIAVSDWEMTNQGLRLKLPILAYPPSHPLHGTGAVLGLLNCSTARGRATTPAQPRSLCGKLATQRTLGQAMQRPDLLIILLRVIVATKSSPIHSPSTPPMRLSLSEKQTLCSRSTRRENTHFTSGSTRSSTAPDSTMFGPLSTATQLA